MDSPGIFDSEAAAQRLRSMLWNLAWETAEQLDLDNKWLVEARRSSGETAEGWYRPNSQK